MYLLNECIYTELYLFLVRNTNQESLYGAAAAQSLRLI